jgi:hypothetical protein
MEESTAAVDWIEREVAVEASCCGWRGGGESLVAGKVPAAAGEADAWWLRGGAAHEWWLRESGAQPAATGGVARSGGGWRALEKLRRRGRGGDPAAAARCGGVVEGRRLP